METATGRMFVLVVVVMLAGMPVVADRLQEALKQVPPPIDIATGSVIPDEGYCDQPYVVKLADGTWLCTMTTGKGHEGQRGQHIVSTRSKDQGKTWSELVDIEPADGPEASWVMPYLTDYGRVYVFYTYNAKDLREIKADNAYARKRVDTQGEYAVKYSDDGGLTWSKERWTIPVRMTAIDRRNPYQGEVRFMWGVGKPVDFKGGMIFGFTKVEHFGAGFIAKSESFFLRCDNINSERDPAKLDWQTLPEGDTGLLPPKGAIASEVNPTVLSDGSLFATYRTVAGHPCHAYSRDGGKTWTDTAFMTTGPGGELINHPRAANFVRRLDEGPHQGKYIYWFHNHNGKDYNGRNPAYLLGGVEVDTPEGKQIQWGKPVAVLYDQNPKTRMSYPDFIWDKGHLYITETQKSIARVHKIPNQLLDKLWEKKETLTLSSGDRPIVTYNAGYVPSPIEDAPWYGRSGFIHPVYSPKGRIVTDPFPADHPHQHGLMFAWTSSEYEGQRVDFWNAKKKQGKVEHVDTIQADDDTIKVKLRHVITTGKHKGVTVLNETWTIRKVAHETLNVFDLVSVQTCATDKPLKIHKHKYGAMCVRGPARWSNGDAMLTSEGKNQQAGNHTRPNWVALFGSAVLHGENDAQTAGIAAMAHPDNQHGPQPVRLHEKMSYFCFAPMVAGDFQIKPGKPYVSKFRFVAFDGEPDPDALNKIWQDYTEAGGEGD